MCVALEVRHGSPAAPTVLLQFDTAHTTGILEWSAQVSCFPAVHDTVLGDQGAGKLASNNLFLTCCRVRID